MKLRTLIVDDDVMARASLERACEKFDELEVVHICVNGEEALELLSCNEIDLVFLDVEMPGISGIDLLDKMTCMPQIVMTTGNKEYAYDALEYEVSDFLIKPFSMPRFQKAVEKVLEVHNQQSKVLNSSIERELYVKSDGRLTRVGYDDVLYFENVGDYVKVKTSKESHVIYGALKSIAERLVYPRFLKVHRSFIVNLDKIVDIEDNSIVIADKVIPISRAHKPILLKSINVI